MLTRSTMMCYTRRSGKEVDALGHRAVGVESICYREFYICNIILVI